MAEKRTVQDNNPASKDGHTQQQQQLNPNPAAATEPLQISAEAHPAADPKPAAKKTQRKTAQSDSSETVKEAIKQSLSDIPAKETPQGACSDQEEVKLLHLEATEAVREIGFAVRHAYKSTTLTSTDQTVYINVQTKEECTLCLELSIQGFRVVGHKFDEVDRSCYSRHYETIYALLDDLSLGYRQSFGETLQNRLEALALEQRAEETQAVEQD
ncbi:GSKIP [Branchiostoma lanceolatum]|uniref:GSKIP protein n=1 Tax=Branchiostoma lanceolatum TaxID=7740 RepID=A0A8K0EGB9_BRALA|nr:GSKIP [Branchiostoma lanceolatum]